MRRCTCFHAPNPACPVDHERAELALDARAAEILTDLTWVATTVSELPLLTHSPESRYQRLDGTTHITPADLRGAATLAALVDGDEAALLAAAKAIRAAIHAEARSKAEQEDSDRRTDDLWAAA